MPRIRTIKPEFWDSPSTAKAGPWARLAFIALWNWADDFGRGTANLKELEGFIFPHDDAFTDRNGEPAGFSGILREVADAFGVVFYEVDGRPFYAIPTWDRHERTDRRNSRSKYPEPPTKPAPTTGNADPRELPGNSGNFPDVPAKSGLEQGNRGTGEQCFLGALATNAHLPAVADSDADKPASPKRGKRLPTGWQPARTEANERAEAGHSPDWLRRELERFHDYWAGISGQRGTKLDWDATWRNWLRNADDRRQPRTGKRAGDLTTDDWDRLLAEAHTKDAHERNTA